MNKWAKAGQFLVILQYVLTAIGGVLTLFAALIAFTISQVESFMYFILAAFYLLIAYSQNEFIKYVKENINA